MNTETPAIAEIHGSDYFQNFDNHITYDDFNSNYFAEGRPLGLEESSTVKYEPPITEVNYFEHFHQFLSSEKDIRNEDGPELFVHQNTLSHESPIIFKSLDTENSHSYYPYTDKAIRHHKFDYRKKPEKDKNVIQRTVVAGLNFGK